MWGGGGGGGGGGGVSVSLVYQNTLEVLISWTEAKLSSRKEAETVHRSCTIQRLHM